MAFVLSSGVRRFLLALCAVCSALALLVPEASAEVESPTETPARWNAPFGGQFHFFVTLATDYAKSGISSTLNEPAFQAGLDWQSPYLLQNGPPMWVYASVSGSNVNFTDTGPGEEIDLAGGVKIKPVKGLSVDIGYIRYLYPSFPAVLGYEYGEYSFKMDYDFGPFVASGRIRYSPDTINHAGQTWEKRLLVSVPLDFIPLPSGLKLRTYGSLGNTWVEKPQILELPGNDFWFWQVGLVASFLGVDLMLAYTDTNIDYSGCGYTRACAGRFFAALSKVF